MIRRLALRLMLGVVTVWGVYTVSFLMVVSLPGNPFQQGDRVMPVEVRRALEIRYRLDNNWRYYVDFLRGAIQLDFGPTLTYVDWTCNQILRDALPVSITIGLSAVALATMIGVPWGVWCAARRDTWFDRAGTSGTMILVSVPTFVVGSLLLLTFAVRFRWLPVGGWGTPGHLPLPIVTLALPLTAYVARLTRSGMMDALGSEFSRMAIARGASRHDVLWGHALPVAFLPVLSYLGPATAQAVTGSFVVEKVFGVPGLGQHFVNAALNRDTGLILATVLVFSTFLVLVNLIVDVLYAILDPRIRGAV